MEPRYVRDHIEADIADRMIFIGGPRQVGKTTLAISLLGQGQNESSPAYLNWDVLADREDILAGRLPSGQTRVIFDEIHKYAQWRNLMKGLFDKNKTS
ncbi:MAG: AAA family ATPase, partial [Gemmatimonadota bacterium]|nr:AAA family ATPase [Gemmatimonadota bacterium]